MNYMREQVYSIKSMLDVCLTQEPGFSTLEDLALTNFNREICAHLLGHSSKDLESVRHFTRSLIWFTYRRDWPSPIGGSGGPTSDVGWGCMIRCGQMLLAQALKSLHLGQHWQWPTSSLTNFEGEKDFLTYIRLLRHFQDKRTSLYSIHQIAQMGISEGKQIGEWLGPNTMSQVMKKLVIYDNWSKIVVHVALNNVLISSDVLMVVNQTTTHDQSNESEQEKLHNDFGPQQNGQNLGEDGADDISEWKRPLLLMIPLRLGLDSINTCYSAAIAEFFKLPQCVGILGGRPRHAVYFYGEIGGKLLYLDPHFCQEFEDLDESPFEQSPQSEEASADHLNKPTSARCSSLGDEPVIVSSSSDAMMLTSLADNISEEKFSHEALTKTTISSFSNSEDSGRNALLLLPSCSSSLRECPSFLCSSPLESICSNSSSARRRSSSSRNKQRTFSKKASISFPTSPSTSSRSPSIAANQNCHHRTLTNSSKHIFDSILGRFVSLFDVGKEENSVNINTEERFDENIHKGDDDLLQHADMKAKTALKQSDGSKRSNFNDSSFHCPYLLSMDFKTLDPSLALGFLVKSFDDYKDLIQRLKNSVLPRSHPPLFEVLDTRPKGWPPFSFEPSYLHDSSINIKEYDDLKYDSDEQFELLE